MANQGLIVSEHQGFRSLVDMFPTSFCVFSMELSGSWGGRGRLRGDLGVRIRGSRAALGRPGPTPKKPAAGRVASSRLFKGPWHH